MVAASFGVGVPEIIILLASWLVVMAAIVGIFFLVAVSIQGWRRAAEAHAQLLEEVRKLRKEITELKNGRDTGPRATLIKLVS